MKSAAVRPIYPTVAVPGPRLKPTSKKAKTPEESKAASERALFFASRTIGATKDTARKTRKRTKAVTSDGDDDRDDTYCPSGGDESDIDTAFAPTKKKKAKKQKIAATTTTTCPQKQKQKHAPVPAVAAAAAADQDVFLREHADDADKPAVLLTGGADAPLPLSQLFTSTTSTTTVTTVTTMSVAAPVTTEAPTAPVVAPARRFYAEDDEEFLASLRVPLTSHDATVPKVVQAIGAVVASSWHSHFLPTVRDVARVHGRACNLGRSIELPTMAQLESQKETCMTHLCASTPVAAFREMALGVCSAFADQLKLAKDVMDAPTRLGRVIPIYSADGKVVTPLLHRAWHPILLQMRTEVDKRGKIDAAYRDLFLLDLRKAALGQALERYPTGKAWKHNHFHWVGAEDMSSADTKLHLLAHEGEGSECSTCPPRLPEAAWSPYVVRYQDTTRKGVPKKERNMELVGQTRDEAGRVALRSLCFVLVDDEDVDPYKLSFIARAQCAFTYGTHLIFHEQTSRASGWNFIMAKSGRMVHVASRARISKAAEQARHDLGLFRVYDSVKKRCDAVAVLDYCRFMWRSIATRDVARLLVTDIPTTVMRFTAAQLLSPDWATMFSPLDLLRFVLWPLYYVQHAELPNPNS